MANPQKLQTALTKWRGLHRRNALRSAYYAGEQQFTSYGIGLPSKMAAQAKTVIGWPRKTVDMLADLTAFTGFAVADDTDTATVEWLTDFARRSNLAVTVQQAAVSAYTHGCAFITLATDGNGLPVLVPRSAVWCYGTWDSVMQRLSSVLTIDSVGDDKQPNRATLHERGVDTVYTRGVMGWQATEFPATDPQRLTAYPVVSNPSLDRPLGVARIDREVMGLTQAAWRTVMRMECTAEYYSSPHVWLVGTAEDFDPGSGESRWSALANAINVVTGDENGQHPTLQQLAQATMTPHGDMLKSLALLLSADTDIPPEALGIDRSNPTSADALAAMERRLSRKADRMNRLLASSLECAARDAAASQGVELGEFHATFAATSEVSEAARVDAFTKICSVSPVYAQTPEAWERLGFDSQQVHGILRKIRAQQATDTLAQLMAAPSGVTEVEGNA